MSKKVGIPLAIGLILAIGASFGCTQRAKIPKNKDTKNIVASDTLLAGMISSLLPLSGYEVTAILPPTQCPGHYDVKLSDIEKLKKADLVVSFVGMPYMEKADIDPQRCLYVDTGGHNWMTPDSHIQGLNYLARELSARFPEQRAEISRRLQEAVRKIQQEAAALKKRLDKAGAGGLPILACSMQKEPLEWMGFRVVGEYGRPESMSAKDIVRLSEVGRKMKVALVADNLQSGPDAGKSIAEALAVPHVVLTNFPAEEGYQSSLRNNVDIVLAALESR